MHTPEIIDFTIIKHPELFRNCFGLISIQLAIITTCCYYFKFNRVNLTFLNSAATLTIRSFQNERNTDVKGELYARKDLLEFTSVRF